MKSFTSFDGIQIAYRDEGKGPAVILLHGGYLDGLGQFGDFERILPLAQRRQEMFREVFGGALPLPNPPVEGRPGLVQALLAAGRAPSCPTCAVSEALINRERKQRTKIQPWRATS